MRVRPFNDQVQLDRVRRSLLARDPWNAWAAAACSIMAIALVSVAPDNVEAATCTSTIAPVVSSVSDSTVESSGATSSRPRNLPIGMPCAAPSVAGSPNVGKSASLGRSDSRASPASIWSRYTDHAESDMARGVAPWTPAYTSNAMVSAAPGGLHEPCANAATPLVMSCGAVVCAEAAGAASGFVSESPTRDRVHTMTRRTAAAGGCWLGLGSLVWSPGPDWHHSPECWAGRGLAA